MNKAQKIFQELGISAHSQGACIGGDRWLGHGGDPLDSYSPADGQLLAQVELCSVSEYLQVKNAAQEAFQTWRMVPAPVRGQVIREIGDELRKHKDALGSLVSLEMGKIKTEGDGEVQEMIDMAEFAVGLSRQLYGLTMHSERPMHRMYEQWHPLGVTGIISAFNFPVAVWSWNAFVAAVCGNTCIWKPSLKTPLTAIAVQHICNKVLKEKGYPGIFNLVIGKDTAVTAAMLDDEEVPLVSFTGSSAVGKMVAGTVHARFGKTLLELGGNNAVLIDETADLGLALRAVVFGAVGTAGQRCTSTRRVLVHENVFDSFITSLKKVYAQLKIGHPLEASTHVGPLIDEHAVRIYENTIAQAKSQGAKLEYGGSILKQDGYYVKPSIFSCEESIPLMKEENFVPIVYVQKVKDLETAIQINNDVPQGLSSSLFTNSLKNAEKFLSHVGSDCGIANINIGTSGAEIGGAFGGEKHTGGGRESGSDAWKAYMRRQTNTINWSDQLPLAQGISFNI